MPPCQNQNEDCDKTSANNKDAKVGQYRQIYFDIRCLIPNFLFSEHVGLQIYEILLRNRHCSFLNIEQNIGKYSRI